MLFRRIKFGYWVVSSSLCLLDLHSIGGGGPPPLSPSRNKQTWQKVLSPDRSTLCLTCRPLGYAGSLITLSRLAGLMMADNNRGVSSHVQPGGPQSSPTQWSGVSVLRYNLADCQGPPGVFCFSRQALHVCYFKYKTWRAVKAQVWCMTPLQINLWPTLLWIAPNEKNKTKTTAQKCTAKPGKKEGNWCL